MFEVVGIEVFLHRQLGRILVLLAVGCDDRSDHAVLHSRRSFLVGIDPGLGNDTIVVSSGCVGQPKLGNIPNMGKQGRVGDQFRERLRSERVRRDWSQSDVAKMLSAKGVDGVYPTTIAKIEAGDRAVRIDELMAIAEIFEVSLDRLLGRRIGARQQDVTFVLQGFIDAARSASVQLSAIEASLRTKSAELAAFDFEARDTIIEGCDWVRSVLTQASEVLFATTVVKSEELQHATTKRWFDEMVLQVLGKGGSDDETQS